MPTPKMGQVERNLFKEITGQDWNADELLEIDGEKKITEFDYENYIHPLLLKKVNTKSPDFKQTIRYLNLTSKTKHEAFQEMKKKFSELMPLLNTLNEDEKRDLIHYMKNSNRKKEDNFFYNEVGIRKDEDEFQKKLAKLSEEENYALKNRYRHQNKTMNYADKSRMPIDDSKVVDLLRFQGEFKHKIVKEIGTYFMFQRNYAV